MAKKSKFTVGDRVWFTYAGPRFKQEGSVEHVRKDGLLIVHFDADPPDAILVVQPYEVDPTSTLPKESKKSAVINSKLMKAKRKAGRREYGVEDETGHVLLEPRTATKASMRDAAKRLAEQRGTSVYLFEVGEDPSDGTQIIVDREEVQPRSPVHGATKKKSSAQLKREIAAVLSRRSSA